jgi:hypothetical protein
MSTGKPPSPVSWARGWGRVKVQVDTPNVIVAKAAAVLADTPAA